MAEEGDCKKPLTSRIIHQLKHRLQVEYSGLYYHLAALQKCKCGLHGSIRSIRMDIAILKKKKTKI